MPDHYLQFCEVLKLNTNEEARWLNERREELENSDAGLGFVMEIQGDNSQVIFSAIENGDTEQLAELVQKYLRKFDPDHCWAFTYAGVCSKMKVGEFDGGGVFVTDEEIFWMNGGTFVSEHRNRFGKLGGVPNIWGEEGLFPLDDWRIAVANDDTRLGYWDWVLHQMIVEEENDMGKVMTVEQSMLRSLGWQQTGAEWTHPVTLGVFDEATAMEVMQRAMEGYSANRDVDWMPSPADMRWQRSVCRNLPEGGRWGIPSSASMFRIFSKRKCAILEVGEPTANPNDRIIAVFLAMGWHVGFGNQLKG